MLKRQRIYPLLLVLAMFIVWQVRKNKDSDWITLSGETMGTTYSVRYQSEEEINYQSQIDSILVDFSNCLSTYIPDSEISQFNKDSVLYFDLPYFHPVLEESRKINTATAGAFEPTIMPLVNAWGFGPDSADLPDSSTVDSLLQFVGFEKVHFDSEKVWKEQAGSSLDFNAIAKGYGVDVVGDFLKSMEVENFFVEIGGEVIAQGMNRRDQQWRIGIEDPTLNTNERNPMIVVELANRGMATSGNYRNFYIRDGIKYSHTIDPSTGYSVYHTLLSATVFAEKCMTADAYATAFMVMGMEKSREILEQITGVDALLIYSDEEGNMQIYSTEGVGKIEEIE